MRITCLYGAGRRAGVGLVVAEGLVAVGARSLCGGLRGTSARGARVCGDEVRRVRRGGHSALAVLLRRKAVRPTELVHLRATVVDDHLELDAPLQ